MAIDPAGPDIAGVASGVHAFRQLRADLGLGAPPDDGWVPVAAEPLLIVVGLSGIGKSSALAEARAAGARFVELPNRRWLTDRLILLPMIGGDEAALARLDRVARLDFTRRYRERHPGGMAEILAGLAVAHRGDGAPPLVFDNLRGVNEVGHAIGALPRGHFLCIVAPDWLRLVRLCGRNDPFDSRGAEEPAAGPPAAADDILALLRRSDLPGGPAAWPLERAAAALAATGQPLAEVARRVEIVRAERRNSDPGAALDFLRRHAPRRTHIIDNAGAALDATGSVVADAIRGLDPAR